MSIAEVRAAMTQWQATETALELACLHCEACADHEWQACKDRYFRILRLRDVALRVFNETTRQFKLESGLDHV